MDRDRLIYREVKIQSQTDIQRDLDRDRLIYRKIKIESQTDIQRDLDTETDWYTERFRYKEDWYAKRCG